MLLQGLNETTTFFEKNMHSLSLVQISINDHTKLSAVIYYMLINTMQSISWGSDPCLVQIKMCDNCNGLALAQSSSPVRIMFVFLSSVAGLSFLFGFFKNIFHKYGWKFYSYISGQKAMQLRKFLNFDSWTICIL